MLPRISFADLKKYYTEPRILQSNIPNVVRSCVLFSLSETNFQKMSKLVSQNSPEHKVFSIKNNLEDILYFMK